MYFVQIAKCISGSQYAQVQDSGDGEREEGDGGGGGGEEQKAGQESFNIREAIYFQTRCFFTYCENGFTGFTMQSCIRYLATSVVNYTLNTVEIGYIDLQTRV